MNPNTTMEFFNNPTNAVLYTIIYVWSIFWKALALWRSAKYDQKKWFVAIFFINFAGIIEIVYLFRYAKNRLTIEEIKGWFGK